MNSINSQIPRLSTLEIAAMGLEKVKAARDEEKEATCDFFLAQVDKQGAAIHQCRQARWRKVSSSSKSTASGFQRSGGTT